MIINRQFIFSFIIFAFLVTVTGTSLASEVNLKQIGHFGGSVEAVDVVGNYAYVGSGDFSILDISNRSSPKLLSRIPNIDAEDIKISGDYAYVTRTNNGFVIININNPSSPTIVGSGSYYKGFSSVSISGNYAYISNPQELLIVDVSNPSSSNIVGSYLNSNNTYCDVTVIGNYAYIASSNGLEILNISNSSSPTLTGNYNTGNSYSSVSVSGNYAYVTDSNGLVIFNISNPSSPTLAGNYSTGSFALDVSVSGNYAYVANQFNGLKIIDISNPYTPILKGSYSTSEYASRVSISDKYAYVTIPVKGLEIVDISNPSSPTTEGIYVTPAYAESVLVSNNNVYVADVVNGLMIFDISNSSDPLFKGRENTLGSAYDLSVSGNYAYVVAGSKGLGIVDISNRSSPIFKGGYHSKSEFNSISVSGNYAYVTSFHDFSIIDISDPYSPIFKGNYLNSGGDYYDVSVSGNYAYIASSSALEIFDIGNSSSPILVGNYNTDNYTYCVSVSGNYAYIAGSYGLSIIDISDPSSPILKGSYLDSGNTYYDITVNGNYAYIASFHGLEILNISNPSSPTLAGSTYLLGSTQGVSVSGNYICIAENAYGLIILMTDIYQTPNGGSLVRIQGHPEVYLIENNTKRHFTSPEALLWNGYSFDNVTNITSETLQTYPDGDNISISQPIIDKYDALGGLPIFGASDGKGEGTGDSDSNGTYCSYVNFANGSIEYFKSGPHKGEAYAVFKPLYTKWASLGYGKSVLGYPTGNMSDPQTSKFGTQFRYQNFANGSDSGALEYNISSGNVYEIHGAIFAKWGSLGFANSNLGLVTSDERDALPSFNSTKGRVSDFENGHLHWHSNGTHYMNTYMTYGDLDKLYVNMGGTNSSLGFPIMDEEERNGHGYCDFEGGNISWDDFSGAYKARLKSDGSLVQVQGNTEVYRIENGKKRHFTSPEALLWNGHGFNEIKYISSEILQNYSDGDNISISQPIINIYNALGGLPIFGTSDGKGEGIGDSDSSGTYCSYVNFENGSIDCFKNGPHKGEAYAVFKPLYTKWASLGYGKSVLGYPVGNMSDPQTSKFGAQFRCQNFANGSETGVLEYNISSGNVYEIHGAIFAKWGSLGFANSNLGLVTGDEKVAATSKFGTVGKYNEFENGQVHWISDKIGENEGNSNRGKSFITYGDLDAEYTLKGGTSSELGFPIMDQEGTGENAYCIFEGGYLGNQNIGDPIPIISTNKKRFNGEIVVEENELITLDDSNSYDNFGNIVSHEWDFGDGDKSEGSSVSHKFGQLGEYNIILKITNNKAKSAYVSLKVHVVKQILEILVVPTNLQESQGELTLSEVNTIETNLQKYYTENSYGSLYLNFTNYNSSIKSSSYKADDIVLECLNKLGQLAYIYDIFLFDVNVNGVNKLKDEYPRASFYDPNRRAASIFMKTDQDMGAWAHEIGHCSGYLVKSSSIYLLNYLPDLDPHDTLDLLTSFSPRVVGYSDLMGRGCYVDPITHMSSFSKLVLNWIKPRVVSYGEFEFKPLEQWKYGDTVPIFITGEDSSYIIEARDFPENRIISDFPFGKSVEDGVFIYRVEKLNLFSQSDISNKVSQKDSDWKLIRCPLVPLPGLAAPNIKLNSLPYIDLFNFILFSVSSTSNVPYYKPTVKIQEPTDYASEKVGFILNNVDIKIKGLSQSLSLSSNRLPSNITRPYPDLDLHAYSNDGLHVGINYSTEDYEVQIPGAIASGDSISGSEWIFVPVDINVTYYINSRNVEKFVELNQIDSKNVSINYSSAFMKYGLNPKLVEREDGKWTVENRTVSNSVSDSMKSGEIKEITIDFSSPVSISNLSSTNSTYWINWTWINPTDPDFNHSEIYLNGTFQTNTSAEYFNATDLQPETSYTLSTRTVDNNGNVNETWVNLTAGTDKEPIPIIPVANFSSNVTEGHVPLDVQFTDLSENVTGWYWDFGDEVNSTEQSPIHTFSAVGNYTVNLTASNRNGTNSHQVSINVLKKTPKIIWSNPIDIVYGTAINDTQLNAIASVPGLFTYTPATGTVLGIGTHTLHVDFTPIDAINYTGASKDIEINVLNASYSIFKSVVGVDEKGDCILDAPKDVIQYRVVVKNEGNISLTNVQVTDSLINLEGPIGNNTAEGVLYPGEIWVYTGNYSVTRDDINNRTGYINNTAMVRCDELPAKSSSISQQIAKKADLSIYKSAIGIDEAGDHIINEVGDNIQYQVAIKNNGNIDLTGVSVNDPMVNLIRSYGDSGNSGVLSPGETWIYDGNYTVTMNDLDSVENGIGIIENTAIVSCDQLSNESSSLELPIIRVPQTLVIHESVSSTDLPLANFSTNVSSGGSIGTATVVGSGSSLTVNTNATETANITQIKNNTQDLDQNKGTTTEANVLQTSEQKNNTSVPVKESKRTPGFEVICSITALIAVFLHNKVRKNN